MEILDPGHAYKLATLDGDAEVLLTFVKRCGDGYPGNIGAYPGTNLQEVLRVLIDRVQYLNQQVFCEENLMILQALRAAFYRLELRAARRHGRLLDGNMLDAIETVPTCSSCGHIQCAGNCRAFHIA